MDLPLDLEPGDVLGIDLIHPETAQTLLPAGTILTEAYIAKIRLLGFTAGAVKSVRIGLDDAAGVPRNALFDVELFLKAKGAIWHLEKAARAWDAPGSQWGLDTEQISEWLTYLIGDLIEKIARLQPEKYADLRLYDAYMYAHPINTAVISLAVGRALGFELNAMLELGLAGLLADAGKFRMPPELVFKGEALTAEEIAQARRHVNLGLELVAGLNFTRAGVIEAIANHHERLDGSGYPRGLQGDAIPVAAQVVGLADSYDAMVSDVPYRHRNDLAVAYRSIEAQAGKTFRAEVVSAFRRYVAPYPVNSLVRLNTGEAGVVVAVVPDNPYKPVVRVAQQEIALAEEPGRRIAGTLVRRYFYREVMGVGVRARLGGHRGTDFNATLNDLSLNGLSLRTDQVAPELGMAIDVGIPIPSRQTTMIIAGRVVWVRRDTDRGVAVGVAFEEISPAKRQGLLDALWNR